MIDIDFRYAMREKLVAADTYGGGSLATKVKVLQWRKKVLIEPLHYLNEPKLEWTDWQDVRTEEE